jgi:hypothetical protein
MRRQEAGVQELSSKKFLPCSPAFTVASAYTVPVLGNYRYIQAFEHFD